MLQMMRNEKFIKSAMWIVIIAFVSWLGIEIGGGGLSSGAAEVGEVNGVAIEWPAYRRDMARLRDAQRSQTNIIPDEFDLDEQAWQQNVRRILLFEAIGQANISVSSEEVAAEMVANPPSGFEQVPTFQDENGNFNRSQYAQFLATITQARWYRITGVSFSEYESQVLFELQVRKLNAHIQDGLWVTEAQVWQAFADQNEKVKVRLVAAPLSIVPDSSVEVDDDEVRAYYQSHLDEYSQDARAKLSYVVIEKTPSVLDSLRILDEVTDIHGRVAAGEDFSELARQFSEDEVSSREGGSVGTFGRGAMVAEFDSVAFGMREGEVSDPVHTQFGWHIIKVERRVKGVSSEEDSVEAKHILIRDGLPGVETLDSLETLAEALSKSGAAFAETAEAQGITVQVTNWFGRDVVYPLPTLARPVRRLVRWAFVGQVGAVTSPVVQDDNAMVGRIVVARLEDRQMAGPKPLADVRDAIVTAIRQRKRLATATEWLSPVAEKVASGESMDAAVQGTDFEVMDVGPFTRNQYLPEVKAGSMDGFIGAAFGLTEPGQKSGLVGIEERGAYIMALVERTLDESEFETQRESIRARLIRRQQQSVLSDWDRYRREFADIVDNRDHVYTYD